MNQSVDAPLPERFRRRPALSPPPTVVRKYNREKYRQQLEQIDRVTEGIKTDVAELEVQLNAYVQKNMAFQRFLPRMEYIIEAMQQYESDYVRELAETYRKALSDLERERDELMVDLPLSYEKMEIMNQMQREFVAKLSAIQKALPATPDINAIEAYMWDNNGSSSSHIATSVMTDEKEPQTFWDYWTLMIATFEEKMKREPSFVIDQQMTREEQSRTLACIARVYSVSVPSYAPTKNSVQIALTMAQTMTTAPDSKKKLAPICASYPPVLTVLYDKKCIDLFHAAADIMTNKKKDDDGIVDHAREVLTGYYILTEKLGIKMVYLNRALQTPLWYNTSAPIATTVPYRTARLTPYTATT